MAVLGVEARLLPATHFSLELLQDVSQPHDVVTHFVFVLDECALRAEGALAGSAVELQLPCLVFWAAVLEGGGGSAPLEQDVLVLHQGGPGEVHGERTGNPELFAVEGTGEGTISGQFGDAFATHGVVTWEDSRSP